MIVFFAIMPHSPLLLPTIGKKHQQKLKKTLSTIKELEGDLYTSKPDTLVICSPHGSRFPNAFSIHLSQYYETNLQEFGDFTTKLKFAPDLQLIERLRRCLRYNSDIPVVLTTELFLDYGTSVPAYLLTKHQPNIRLVSICDSGLPLKRHYEFGQALQEEIIKTKTRIAFIASADLSHCLTDKAPGGFSPEGKKFDEAVVKYIKDRKYERLFELENKIVEAKVCGLKTIMILLGIMDKLNCSPELLSYEGPFGVGYLVAKFKLP